MCEILAISCSKPTTMRFSGIRMSAESKYNGKGWGVGFFPVYDYHKTSKTALIIKDPGRMRESSLLNIISDKEAIHSKIILNHIRYGREIEITIDNAQPFSREIFGREWIFINAGIENLDKYYERYAEEMGNRNYEPIGSSMSERLFCIIADKIKNTVDREYNPEEIAEIIKETGNELKEFSAKSDFVLSDGEYIYAYNGGYINLGETNGLFYVQRNPCRIKQLIINENDGDFYGVNIFREFIDEKAQKYEKAVVIASVKLTESEDWHAIKENTVMIFKNGEIIKQIG